MTELNINCMDRVVDELAKGKTISEALESVYYKRKVRVPIRDNITSIKIEDLGLAGRTTNAIKRAHLNTIGDVVEFVERGRNMTDIPALGRVSIRDFMEAVLNHSWNLMSLQEKVDFLMTTVERNVCNIRL